MAASPAHAAFNRNPPNPGRPTVCGSVTNQRKSYFNFPFMFPSAVCGRRSLNQSVWESLSEWEGEQEREVKRHNTSRPPSPYFPPMTLLYPVFALANRRPGRRSQLYNFYASHS